MIRYTLAVLALVISAPAFAQSEGKMMRVSTGTGFFVNSAGYFITNQHVVDNCQKIMFRGTTNSDDVELVAADATQDLAILRMKENPKYTAPMRMNDGLAKDDDVMVIGYPQDAIFKGNYVIRTAQVIDTKGPQGEDHWVQFTDSAQHGNSGGPLLDGSGNVIGVVTGKMTMYDPADPEGTVRKADVAVRVPILKRFMDSHSIPYDNLISNDDFVRLRRIDTADIERNAGKFITGVVCMQGEVEDPAAITQ